MVLPHEDRPLDAARPRPREARALLLVALAGVLAAGWWVRLRGLPHLLLLHDELHAIRVASGLDPLAIATSHSTADSSTPLTLYAWMLLRWDALDEVTLRLPGIVAGALLPLLGWCLAPRIGRPAALLAAALLAIWPPFVYYSILARPYSLALFLTLGTLVVWDRWRGSGTRPRSILLGVTAAAAVFFQVFTLFPVTAVLVVAAVTGRRQGVPRRELAWALVAFGVTGLLLLGPGLPSWIEVHGDKLGAGRWDRSTLGVVAASFGAGVPALGVALGGLGLAGTAVAWRRDPPLAAACAGAVLATVAGVWSTSPAGTAHAWTRYLLVALPHLVVLAATCAGAADELLAGRRAAPVAVAAAAALVAGVWLGSPARLLRRDPDSFRTSRDALLAERAPAPVPSPLYARVRQESEGACVIVCPVPSELVELSSHGRAQRWHGLWVRLGVLRPPGGHWLSGQRNVVNLLDGEAVRDSGARFALLHADLLETLPPRLRGPRRRELRWRTRFARNLLRLRCGPPVQEEPSVEVYDLSRWDDSAPADLDRLRRNLRRDARRAR